MLKKKINKIIPLLILHSDVSTFLFRMFNLPLQEQANELNVVYTDNHIGITHVANTYL